MSENEAILSEEALVRLNADGWEIPAEVYESHEALRKERDEYRMAAGAEADHADEQRARAAHWYTQSAEAEDRARAEINRLDEALVARAVEVSHQANLIAVISPYVQHRPFCVKSGGRCTCGLITALTEVNETLENLHAE